MLLILGFWQFRKQIGSLIIGNDELDKFGGKVGGLRNYPDSRFGGFRAGYHATDITIYYLSLRFANPRNAGRSLGGHLASVQFIILMLAIKNVICLSVTEHDNACNFNIPMPDLSGFGNAT